MQGFSNGIVLNDNDVYCLSTAASPERKDIRNNWQGTSGVFVVQQESRF